MRVLCFDPGEKIGYAYITVKEDKSYGFDYDILDYKTFNDWLKEHKDLFEEADVIVIEEYRVLPGKAKAHAGSKLETARAIGALKLYADLNDCKVFMSDARNNPVNLRMNKLDWALKLPHSKTHWVFALAHGLAFLRKIKAIS